MNYDEIKNSEFRVFYHITNKNNIKKILKEGIVANDGQEGYGVYCILKDDYNTLIDGLIELFDNRGISLEDLKIIEFKYNDKFLQVPIENLIYSNEGWVKINNDISKELILNILDIE